MAEVTLIAKFKFVVNKSFKDVGIVTIPNRLVGSLKEHGLGDGAPAEISFRGQELAPGLIRSGWRAGGRYYQISARSAGTDELMIGSTLAIRMLKSGNEWRVEFS